MSTKMVPAICTQCGAQITADPAQKTASCSYCGTTFVVQHAIDDYIAYTNNTYNTYNIHQKKGTVESTLDFIDKQLDRKERLAAAERERKEAAKAKRRKTTWWVLGWIFFFPIPFSILIYRSSRIPTKVKYGLLAVLWACILFPALFNKETSKNEIAIRNIHKKSDAVFGIRNTSFTSDTTAAELYDFSYCYPNTWIAEEQFKGGQKQYRYFIDGNEDIMLVCRTTSIPEAGSDPFDALNNVFEGMKEGGSFELNDYQKVLFNEIPGLIADGSMDDEYTVTSFTLLKDGKHLFGAVLANSVPLSEAQKQNVIALLESVTVSHN